MLLQFGSSPNKKGVIIHSDRKKSFTIQLLLYPTSETTTFHPPKSLKVKMPAAARASTAHVWVVAVTVGPATTEPIAPPWRVPYWRIRVQPLASTWPSRRRPSWLSMGLGWSGGVTSKGLLKSIHGWMTSSKSQDGDPRGKHHDFAPKKTYGSLVLRIQFPFPFPGNGRCVWG